MTEDTEFGPQIDAQAWSAADPSQAVAPYRECHSWATVVRHAAAMVSGAALVAWAVLVLDEPSDSTASAPSSPTALPVVNDTVMPPDPPPFTMPPDIPVAHETADGEFLQLLIREYFDFGSGQADAIEWGHRICTLRRQGYSAAYLAAPTPNVTTTSARRRTGLHRGSPASVVPTLT